MPWMWEIYPTLWSNFYFTSSPATLKFSRSSHDKGWNIIRFLLRTFSKWFSREIQDRVKSVFFPLRSIAKSFGSLPFSFSGSVYVATLLVWLSHANYIRFTLLIGYSSLHKFQKISTRLLVIRHFKNFRFSSSKQL